MSFSGLVYEIKNAIEDMVYFNLLIEGSEKHLKNSLKDRWLADKRALRSIDRASLALNILGEIYSEFKSYQDWKQVFNRAVDEYMGIRLDTEMEIYSALRVYEIKEEG